MSELREQKTQERAYELYLKSDRQDGFALDDWLHAEQELQRERTAEPVAQMSTRERR